MSVNRDSWIDNDGDGDCDPGEGVEYIVFVQNTGTITMSDLQVSDGLLGESLDCGESPAGGYLAPKSSITCTGTYQVKGKKYLKHISWYVGDHP